MKAKVSLSRDYVEFVTALKHRIVSARLHAARAVNRDLIFLYWDIGKRIVEKQRDFGWGDAVVESLSEDLLKAFPNMRRFYSAYSSPEFLPQVVAENLRAPLKATDLTAKQALEFLRQLVAEVPCGQHY